MGFSHSYAPRLASYNEEMARREAVAFREKEERDVAQAASLAAARERLARKVVMAMTDTIINDIVRPGPIAEERECYDMAQEVRDHCPVLLQLVLAILNVNEGCP